MFFKKKNTATEPDIRTPKGFERIYQLYAEDLFAIVLNQLNDPSEAENIVHDVFCRIWERKNELQIEGPVKNYLFRSVKLSVIKYIRNKSARKKLDAVIFKDVPQKENSVENKIEYTDLNAAINELVNRLPQRTRVIYRLSREQAFTNKEIASELIISEKTVESHLTRTLKFLRSNLEYYRR